MKASSVSIVIPNWNGSELLQKHLPAVLVAAAGAEVIVVDDGSDDDSVIILEKKYPSISIVARPNHNGFASAVNDGVAMAKGSIVVLLNTDIEPKKDFLEPLLKHFADNSVFAVGCMDRSMESGSVVLRGRGIARWEKGYFIHQRGDVDAGGTAWVSGGSGAFRKDVWFDLGGMDELYDPFYWEDIDISYRALKAGYRIVFEPKSVVDHFHELGKIKTSFTPFRVNTIAYRNQFIFIWKNLSDTRIWIEHMMYTPVRLFQALLRGDNAMIEGYARAMLKLVQVMLHRLSAKSHWKRKDREIPLA